MKPQIAITKSNSRNENNLTMNIHVAASRNDAIEMLAYGSRAIMDTLDIPLMVFLEALMNVSETSSLEKSSSTPQKWQIFLKAEMVFKSV